MKILKALIAKLKALIARLKQKLHQFSSKCPHCHIEREIKTLEGKLWAHCAKCDVGENVR